MQDMDQGLVNCPDLCIPDDLSEYLSDENLDKIVDPDILLDCLLTCEIDAESYSEVPAPADVQQGPQENTESIGNYSRKRQTVPTLDPHYDDEHTSRPKRQRTKAASDPDWGPDEVFSTVSPEILQVQSPSQDKSAISPIQIITIRKTSRSPMIPTIRLSPLFKLSNTATAPAFILVPASPHLQCKIPPLSPVNGAVAPVQLSSSPSGSLSDSTAKALFPVCSSPQSTEKSPIKESPAFQHPLIQDVPQTVKDYIQETKAYMSKTCDNLGDGLTLSSHYVDSKIIQRDIVRAGKNPNKSLDKELDVMGETDRKRSVVGLNQIFERRHGYRSKNYSLLVAKAGMGKTTCIKKLCLDWSKDCLPQFDFVFLLDGKLLTITEPTHNLETLLLKISSFAPSCSDSESVFTQILAAPKRVLIIFDGFEDLREFELLIQPFEKDLAAGLQKDKKIRLTIKQLYSAILQRVLLPGCSLLLSSRPRGSASQLLRRVDNLLEVCGFSPQDVETYMKHYFSDVEIEESAINCLQNCSYLKLLCWNPGLCQLVCTVLEQQQYLETLPRTLTGICHRVLRLKMETEFKSTQGETQQLFEEVTQTKHAQKSQLCSRQRASRKTEAKTGKSKENKLLTELSCLAWETVKANSSVLPSGWTVSSKIRAVGLRTGLLHRTRVRRRQCFSNAGIEKEDTADDQTNQATTMDSENGVGVCEDYVLSWANPFLQSYLAAVHLSLSCAAFVKTFSFQTGSKSQRRPQKEEFELTQRFAVGLLFHNQTELQWLHPHTNKYYSKTVVNKQNALIDHLKCLPFGNLSPSKILDLCHFVYEGSFTDCGSTEASGCSQLVAYLVNNLPEKLTFNGVPLSPADVFTIKNILEHRGNKVRSFSIDLQDSGVHVAGLRSIVGLDNISTYRACIADVIIMWEELEREKEDHVLCDAVSKFKIDPFKATQVCHIEHLAKLVDIHTSKRLSDSQSNSVLADGVPAVTGLHELELELGPENGPLAFPKLWEVLLGLHNLQHLDLENNKIGDNGAENLAEVLVSLSSLETLNLSQNCIGDHGAKKLAAALMHLSKLDGLSLHSNVISDEGAESLAAVLPHMAALTELDIRYNKLTDVGAQSLGTSLSNCQQIKSLRMWSQCITYGLLAKLHQRDHRIMDT